MESGELAPPGVWTCTNLNSSFLQLAQPLVSILLQKTRSLPPEPRVPLGQSIRKLILPADVSRGTERRVLEDVMVVIWDWMENSPSINTKLSAPMVQLVEGMDEYFGIVE